MGGSMRRRTANSVSGADVVKYEQVNNQDHEPADKANYNRLLYARAHVLLTPTMTEHTTMAIPMMVKKTTLTVSPITSGFVGAAECSTQRLASGFSFHSLT